MEDDEELFRQPPPRDDCPVCFLRMPMLNDQRYMPCCGKTICYGCIKAVEQRAKASVPRNGTNNELSGQCPFCRAPFVKGEQLVERLNARIAMNDSNAMTIFGNLQIKGDCESIPQDVKQGIEMLSRAAELGCGNACGLLGDLYHQTRDEHQHFDSVYGVEKDDEKAIHYYEIAAKTGHEQSRHNLGCLLIEQSNESNGFTKQYKIMVAMKHFLIAAAQGFDKSLEAVKDGYIQERIAKDEFAQALRAHKDSKDEVKSDQREGAKAR